MKNKIFTSAFLAASLLAFGIGAAAQRSTGDKSQQDRMSQGQMNSGMMGGGMMGQGPGMTGGGMKGMMGQMTTHHQQMSTLMNKLMQSFSAIQNEKDPEALKSKLEEHQGLLNQMRNQMMQQGKMMNVMSGQIKQSCPGAGDTAKAPEK